MLDYFILDCIVLYFGMFQLEMAPPLRDEIIVDRATQESARSRFDTLNKDSDELDAQSRQLGEAYETMIRIQDRYVMDTCNH